MTISGLERIRPEERAGVLATIALATSPNPIEKEKKRLNRDEQAILDEIFEQIGVVGGEISDSTRVRLDSFLTTAIRDAVLDKDGKAEALARAGDAGRLPPSMYSIDIPDGFRATFKPLYIREDDVAETIKHPDDIQHLEPGEDSAVSLFARYITNLRNQDPFWTIAHTHRLGSVIRAHSYWRVYPSEIDLKGALCPVDLLKALSTSFGIDLSINEVRKRFFFQDRVPIKTLDSPVQIEVHDPYKPPTKAIQQLTNIFAISGKRDAVALREVVLIAYAFSVPLYQQYLVRHGVNLRQKDMVGVITHP